MLLLVLFFFNCWMLIALFIVLISVKVSTALVTVASALSTVGLGAYSIQRLRRMGAGELPALAVTKDGIVDNASPQRLGQIAWGDLKWIYPWTDEYRLPFIRSVVFRRHCLILLMHESYVPKGKATMARRLFAPFESGKPVRISDKCFSLPLDNLMADLNGYYQKNVIES